MYIISVDTTEASGGYGRMKSGHSYRYHLAVIYSSKAAAGARGHPRYFDLDSLIKWEKGQ